MLCQLLQKTKTAPPLWLCRAVSFQHHFFPSTLHGRNDFDERLHHRDLPVSFQRVLHFRSYLDNLSGILSVFLRFGLRFRFFIVGNVERGSLEDQSSPGRYQPFRRMAADRAFYLGVIFYRQKSFETVAALFTFEIIGRHNVTPCSRMLQNQFSGTRGIAFLLNHLEIGINGILIVFARILVRTGLRICLRSLS